MRVRGKLIAASLLALLAATPPWAVQPSARAQSKSEAQPTPTATPPSTPPSATPQTQATPQVQATPPKAVGADDDEVLSVETNLVNILFNAVDKDRRFVTTLTRDDVRVFENDAPQEVSVFERETNLPLSLAILVDVSGSQEVTLVDEKIAARAFIESFLRPGKDNAAVVSFTGTATVEQDLTQDRKLLNDAITRLQVVLPPSIEEGRIYQAGESAEVVPKEIDEYGTPGTTALWDSIWATANEIMAQTPRQTRRAMIILSDGDDSGRPWARLERADAVAAAVKADTIIYSVGVEPDCPGHQSDCRLDKKALRRVAEETGGRAFFPKDDTELRAAFNEINQELRTQYLVSYTPTNKARDGSWRRVRLEIVNKQLRDQKIKLSYRDGYFATPPPAKPPQRRERAPEERLKRPPRKPRKT
ncbi:MAG: VWA domain-containing protein [Pyrinomonadaceae bacterium]